MASVSQVRAEIKAWERRFKEQNESDPSVDDIKADPPIAEKYKLYKKLCRESETKSASALPQLPKPGSLLQPLPRAVPESTAPLSTYNPFSPQKKAVLSRPEKLPNVNINPFLSSKKSRSPFESPNKHLRNVHHEDSTPISRARKRLRGEEVSPSPIKGKRFRVDSPFQPFAKPSDSDLDDSDEEDTMHANSSFLDDSPIKVPSGSRSFKGLFDDSKDKDNRLRNRGEIRALEDQDNHRSRSHAQNSQLLYKAASIDSDSADMDVDTVEVSSSSTLSAGLNGTLSSSLTLLPPSPTSDTAPSIHKANTKVKGKAVPGKLKSTEFTSDEEVEGLTSARIKVVSGQHRRAAMVGSDQEDSDHEDYRFGVQSLSRPSNSVSESKRMDVSVHENLKRVLDLQSADDGERNDFLTFQELLYSRREKNYHSSRGGEIWDVGEAEDLPTGMGSGDDITRQGKSDDDWEGEPIPWAVGEL